MARTAKLEYENFAASTCDGAILAGDGTLDVQAGDAAALFPAATDFNVRVGDDTQGYEIVKVTNVAGDTFTITRAQEGTGALGFNDATAVWLVVSKEYIEQLQRPLEIIEDGYQKNLLPEAFLMEWGSNGDNWPGASFTANAVTLSNAQFYCGLLSLKIDADNLELWVCSAGIGSYNIPLIIGQKYVASMYCREDAGAGEVTLRVRQDDGDNHDGGATAVDNVSWTRVYSAFTADSEMCNIQVLNTHAANKVYYCDAFQLEMVDSTVTVPSDYSPPAATATMLQDVDIEGEITVDGDVIAESNIVANGDQIVDSGGASGISFDGAGSVTADVDLNVVGDTTLDGDTTVGDDYTADTVIFDSQIEEVSAAEPSHIFRAASPKNYCVNGDFETWLQGTAVIPTAWTETDGACTFAQEAATTHNSKYSMKITVGGSPARIDATLRLTPTQARNRTFTASVWVYTDTPLKTVLVVKDDAGNDQVVATLTDTWEKLTVTRQIDAGTATLRMYLYLTENADVMYFDGAHFSEGPMEWAYAPGEESDGLGSINLPLAGWWDSSSSACLDVVDNDPALGTFAISWLDADTDRAITTAVIPEDYNADVDDCWFCGYYYLGAAEDNVTLDLETYKQRLGAAFDAAATAYDHTAVYHGVNDQNVDRAVYLINETLQPGDVLQIRAVRADDGVDTADLYMVGANLIYVKR